MGDKLFPYSEQFVSGVRRQLQAKTHLPERERNAAALEEVLCGRQSRILRNTCREIQHHCGNLKGKRILDFGCGDGASTVALAQHFGGNCREIAAFDIDEDALELCRLRVGELGLGGQVEVFPVATIEDLAETRPFDLVLVNAVLEHIPLSVPGLRRKVIRTLFEMLEPRGWLVITMTPNRLWPIDRHTTGMWWLPWAKPGSGCLYRKAMRRGKHWETPEVAAGRLGLEQRGAWGATYWEIIGYLDPASYVCVNTQPGHDRHVYYAHRGGWRRRTFDTVMHVVAVRLLRVPITAFAPSLANIFIQRK